MANGRAQARGVGFHCKAEIRLGSSHILFTPLHRRRRLERGSKVENDRVGMPQTLPFLEPACVMSQTLKGYTSRDPNRLLRRTGEPFWQAESYDRWVHDGRELERIRDNFENKLP